MALMPEMHGKLAHVSINNITTNSVERGETQAGINMNIMRTKCGPNGKFLFIEPLWDVMRTVWIALWTS